MGYLTQQSFVQRFCSPTFLRKSLCFLNLCLSAEFCALLATRYLHSCWILSILRTNQATTPAWKPEDMLISCFYLSQGSNTILSTTNNNDDDDDNDTMMMTMITKKTIMMIIITISGVSIYFFSKSSC